MKTVINIFLYSLISMSTYSQSASLLMEPYEQLFKVDHHMLFSLASRRKSIFFDIKALDSSGAKLEYVNLKEGVIRGVIEKKNRRYSFTLPQLGKINLSPVSKFLMLFGTEQDVYYTQQVYYDSIERNKLEKNQIEEGEYLDRVTHPYGRNLYRLRPNSKDLLFDLDSLFKDSIASLNNSQIIDIYELSQEKLLVITSDCSGGCEYYHYFEYDNIKKRVRNIDQLKSMEPNNSFFNVRFLMKDINHSNHLGFYHDYAVKDKEHSGFFLFDKNLNIVLKVLPRYSENIGYNYVNGGIDSYNIRSRLDDDKSVIVPFKLELALERSMTRIYNSQEMLPEDIQSLNNYSASILKNFIYAKHNFKFSDIFYQSYFNLFEFYRGDDKKAARLVKVDNLFTPTDKKSLVVINAILSKLK